MTLPLLLTVANRPVRRLRKQPLKGYSGKLLTHSVSCSVSCMDPVLVSQPQRPAACMFTITSSINALSQRAEMYATLYQCWPVVGILT